MKNYIVGIGMATLLLMQNAYSIEKTLLDDLTKTVAWKNISNYHMYRETIHLCDQEFPNDGSNRRKHLSRWSATSLKEYQASIKYFDHHKISGQEDADIPNMIKEGAIKLWSDRYPSLSQKTRNDLCRNEEVRRTVFKLEDPGN